MPVVETTTVDIQKEGRNKQVRVNTLSKGKQTTFLFAFSSLLSVTHRHTLTLVLRGEWPKWPVAKTHLCVMLQKCVSQLVQHPAASKCTSLLALVNNPWKHPVLDSILNGQPDSEHEEGKKHPCHFPFKCISSSKPSPSQIDNDVSIVC